MKYFFQFLFIGLAFISFAQKKTFDLKESVLKQRALSPVRLNNFQWIPETEQYTACCAAAASASKPVFTLPTAVDCCCCGASGRWSPPATFTVGCRFGEEPWITFRPPV